MDRIRLDLDRIGTGSDRYPFENIGSGSVRYPTFDQGIGTVRYPKKSDRSTTLSKVLPFPRNANPHIHRRINFTT